MTLIEKYERLMAWFNDHKAELETQPAMVVAIKANYEVERMVHDLYFALENKPLGGCGSCLADALIILLTKDTKQRMKEISECHFQLRNGVLLQDTHGKLPMATAANLTDEIAVAYLRDNIARKNLFKVLPENLDEYLAEKPKPKAEAKPKAEPKKEETEQGAEKPATGDEKPEGEQLPTDSEKAPENPENGEQNKLTAEAIQAMSYKELQAAAKEQGIKTFGLKKEDLVDALLATL